MFFSSSAVASAMIRMVICIEQSTPSSEFIDSFTSQTISLNPIGALEKFTVMGMPPYDILVWPGSSKA